MEFHFIITQSYASLDLLCLKNSLARTSQNCVYIVYDSTLIEVRTISSLYTDEKFHITKWKMKKKSLFLLTP